MYVYMYMYACKYNQIDENEGAPLRSMYACIC